jgi:hypothetical protein
VFHHMVYTAPASAGAVVLADVPAVADTVFTTQGATPHFIFTDQLQLLAAAALGATITQAQIYSPTLIPYGLLNVWPLNTAITPASFPRILNFTMRPFVIPTNEQIQALVSDSAIDTYSVHLWVAPVSSWNQNQVRGQYRSILKLTAATALLTQLWTGPQALTFQNIPKGGWYAVNAAWCFCATARSFRLYFPRAPTVSGRQLRPGGLVSHARGDMVKPGFDESLGLWGAFHTFEPVQAEYFGDAAGAATQELYLDVDFLGAGSADAYPLAA